MSSPADPSAQRHLTAIHALQQQAQAAGQRGLVVIAGSPAWGRELAAQIWNDLDPALRLWLSNRPKHEPHTAMSKAGQFLGQERKLVVVDAHDGFSADAFGAISGTLIGGGLMLLLTPALADWSTCDSANPYGHEPSRFIRHLVLSIQQDPAVLLLQEPDIIRPPEYQYALPQPVSYSEPFRSADQQQAVETIMHLAGGHRHRPLVITSDRGRGKSASLGIAAAWLLQHPGYRIVVCAPRPAACNSLFEMAFALLPQAVRRPNRLEFNGGYIQFMAADALLEQLPEINLLLIDEAAGLPVSILQRLLQHYSRIVFATTVHGYEGTGRGFALKFHRVLDQQTPGWHLLRLTQPIRWNNGDPLERFVYSALVLDALPDDEINVKSIQPADVRFVRIDRNALIQSPDMLNQLFGLLVLAHYRTRPDDLYRLLDAPDIRLYGLLYQSRPVAVGVVSLEGKFDPQTSEAIYLGQRRPQGHLLAQTLAFHVGVPDAARYHYARIMRLGVHPRLQRRGLGSHLLQQILDQLDSKTIDAVGASFAATDELLRFWQHAGMSPVRMGLTREHTSGAHAAVVLKPLSADGETVFNRARDRFIRHLPSLLADPLRDLDAELISRLVAETPSVCEEALTEADHQDIRSFIYGQRGYEVCAWPIEKLIRQLFADPKQAVCLSPVIRKLLSLRVLQKHNWKTIIAELQLDGRKSALQLMRQAVRQAYTLVERNNGRSAD